MAKNSPPNISNLSPKTGLMFKIAQYEVHKLDLVRSLKEYFEKEGLWDSRVVVSTEKEKEWAIISVLLPNDCTKAALNRLDKLAKKFATTTYESKAILANAFIALDS